MLPIIAIGAFYIVFALVSRRLRTTVITAPLVFVAFGYLIGTDGLRLLTPFEDGSLVTLVLEVTLVITLFNDAATISPRELRRESTIPLRLLLLGLPLTLALGWALGVPLFPEMGLLEVGVLAALLAPTDAALGQAVVESPRVPPLIRHGLGVESGLNDGIVLPILTLLLAGAAEAAGELSSGAVAKTFAHGLLLAAAVGAVVAYVVAQLLVLAARRGWAGPRWQQATAVILALLVWATVDALDGSGFIGAWAAGIVFGAVTRSRLPRICTLGDELSAYLITLSFLLYGALILGPNLDGLTWQVVLYAVLSLTIIRMLPVAAAMIGSGLRRASVSFLGWFGPRGLASIIFVELVVENELPASGLISQVVMVTVALSVLLHGLSAWPTSQAYGSWFDRHVEAGESLVESEEVRSVPIRRPLDMTAWNHRNTDEGGRSSSNG